MKIPPVSRGRITFQVALALWCACCIAILVLTLWLYSPGPSSDAAVLLYWYMLALTFPSGLAVAAAGAGIIALVGDNLVTAVPSWAAVLAIWGGFVAIGYWQWFVGLPWLWRRIKKARHAV